MNDSFVFYASYAQGIRTLPPEDQLTLINAVIDYMLYDKEPELEGVVYGMFCLIVPTAKAACKRHKDKQSAAHTRWHKDQKPAEPTPAPAPPKPVEKQDPPPSAPAGEQPESERSYHIGTFHNVFLTEQEHKALQKQLGDDFHWQVNRFSKYKMKEKFTLLYDYPALQHFMKHGNIPDGRFDRTGNLSPPFASP